MYRDFSVIIFSALCIAAACAASDQSAAEVDASCNAPMQPSEATRAVTQSALLACSTVLQPTGALDWLIDAQQVRLRDVLDGRLVDAIEPLPHHRSTLAELVQQCWHGKAVPFRAFLSDAHQQTHSRMCNAASTAAADALHSPLLGLSRVIMSFDSLPVLPIAIAASILPHATVAVVLICFAPAAIVIYPIWSLAILFFALVDLCHTLPRAAVAFRSSANRFVTFFLRRLFVRVAVVLVVAIFDCVAELVSACTQLLAFLHVVCADVPLNSFRPQPPVFPFSLSARLCTVLATLDITGGIAGSLQVLYVHCTVLHRNLTLLSPWRPPIFVDSAMNTFDSLWRLWVSSASAREAAYRLQQRAVIVREEFQKKEFLSALE